MPKGIYNHKKGGNRGSFKKGRPSWNSNHHLLKKCLVCNKEFRIPLIRKETAKFCSGSCRGKFYFGDKSFRWAGGVSIIDRRCRQLEEYKKWRSDVFTRDGWTCKTCYKDGCYVTAHHIKSFSTIIRDNNIKTINDARKCQELWDVSNGVTLCEECHKLTDNYKGRKKN